MNGSVMVAKEANTKKEFSPTKSDNSIHRVRNEPERQLGSLRRVIDNIRRDGGTPSVDSIATELSSMHSAQRASVLLALQRTHGNRYVQRVVTGIQAKLKVGQPGDVYEQEADRVAEAVIRMPEPPVQRQIEEELVQLKLKTTPEYRIQRQEEEEEEILLTKKRENTTPEVTHDLESRIHALQGGGQPLPEHLSAYFEPQFGYNFSHVRVHTDAKAAESARAVNARAFTVGKNVVFGEGQYSPQTTEGKQLLAHELTHVVQQIGVTRASVVNAIYRMPDDWRQTSTDGDTLEVETEMFAAGGEVRTRAVPEIVSPEGDQLLYRCAAEVTNRPFQVIVGVRTIAVGTLVAQRIFPRSRLRRWQAEGRLRLPRWTATPGSGLEFFVRLEPTGAEPIEYSVPLQFDPAAVELSRVLHAEAGRSLAGMVAVAHVINNRIASGSPARQVDTSSSWPDNFINTGFLLNPGRARGTWPGVTSAASRALAQLIIRQHGPPGTDPSGGALFYRAAGRADLERTSPTFQYLRQQVEHGRMRRVTIGGNVFYAPVPRRSYIRFTEEEVEPIIVERRSQDL